MKTKHTTINDLPVTSLMNFMTACIVKDEFEKIEQARNNFAMGWEYYPSEMELEVRRKVAAMKRRK